MPNTISESNMTCMTAKMAMARLNKAMPSSTRAAAGSMVAQKSAPSKCGPMPVSAYANKGACREARTSAYEFLLLVDNTVFATRI